MVTPVRVSESPSRAVMVVLVVPEAKLLSRACASAV